MQDKISKAAKRYRQNNSSSGKLWKRAKKVFPGGVSHNIRTWGLPQLDAYPFFIADAKGSNIWDVDGNKYIDFWIGHEGLLFGHTPKHVINAVQEQAQQGTHWGITNEEAVTFAELIRDTVPSIEKLRFTASGTEATMYAVRIARAYTENNKILKIRGGWHGANTDLTYAINYPYDYPESKGIPSAVHEDCLSIPFNDIEETQQIIQEHKDDIAGLIIEPILGAGGAVPADREYLQYLREAANDYGFCLIFDEVITGFRITKGGAQAYYDIQPDLTTLGKTTGGGLPIGVIGGKAQIMDIAKPRDDPQKRAFTGGGTFSCNPITMTAGMANIKEIRRKEDKIYPYINDLGQYARKNLSDILANSDLPTKVTGTHSMVMVHFLTEEIGTPTPKKLQKYQDHEKSVEFRLRLLNKGIFQFHGMGALCTKHTKEQIDTYLNAVKKTIKQME